jgi:biopolymer transport protein ExbD
MAFSAKDGGADDVVSEINVTPLVDVMLVLLVVFIVPASARITMSLSSLGISGRNAPVPTQLTRSPAPASSRGG